MGKNRSRGSGPQGPIYGPCPIFPPEDLCIGHHQLWLRGATVARCPFKREAGYQRPRARDAECVAPALFRTSVGMSSVQHIGKVGVPRPTGPNAGVAKGPRPSGRIQPSAFSRMPAGEATAGHAARMSLSTSLKPASASGLVSRAFWGPSLASTSAGLDNVMGHARGSRNGNRGSKSSSTSVVCAAADDNDPEQSTKPKLVKVGPRLSSADSLCAEV